MRRELTHAWALMVCECPVVCAMSLGHRLPEGWFDPTIWGMRGNPNGRGFTCDFSRGSRVTSREEAHL